ncbi:type II toxin-antitoxin system HipA family toxin [Nonomuraea mesophila]|uniref:Type II toxin-antitoxin system HipA family toxin n=1 Tax=Nonomuraea mesophila TaxID=2530382 RepID=A0A4R5EWX4_9ACTN|nr:type II toxin-antitoxin system HipA family toxin [Nonomuraea mesophila]TDE39505.1 type II toxin-antitoxin system HipA family toxin [Nonomuraea mesophila]
MPDRTLMVLLNGVCVGELAQDAMGRIRFSYDMAVRSWLPKATPLSLSLTPDMESHEGPEVAAFLWGLLPENPAVLSRWAREHGVSAANPVALLRHVGMDCAGAVQFVPLNDHGRVLDVGGVEWLDDDGIAQIIRGLHHDSAAWHPGHEEGQFSLAGVQAKVALLREGGKWGRTWGRIPTTHIIKPAIPDLIDQDVNEHLCLAAARAVGLTAARTEIRTFGDQTAVVVERYDRVRIDDMWVRVHQEDLCQSLGLHPVHKYQSEGGPGPEDVAALFRRVQPSTEAHESVRAFVDALIFTWLLAGTDGHAKNYSVLLSGDQVRPAPLYDISSALPYPDVMNPHKIKLAMKIGREYRLKSVGWSSWRRLAERLDLDCDALWDRIDELAAALPDALSDAAATPEVRSLRRSLPGALVDAAAARVRELLRLPRAAARG